jgi:hypothetical protein
MATFILTRPDLYPTGTSVSLYSRLNQQTGLPSGASSQTQVTDGSGNLTFTSLNDSATYYAYAASPDRVVQFSTPPVAGGGVASSVTVSNFPGTQPVSGTVGVSNFPATQPVSGTFWQTTQPVSGSLGVSSIAAGTNNIGQTDTARYSTVTTTTPTPGTTSGTLIASSGSRKLLVLMNVGNYDVWARDDGSAAVVGVGVFLPALVGTYIEDRVPGNAWVAIADGGTAAVTVREYA